MIPFWPPREITFKTEQVRWLLEHKEMVRRGDYPKDPQQGDHADPGGGRRSRHGASFETPLAIIAEIDWRLDRCYKHDNHRPRDRELVEMFYWEDDAGLTKEDRYSLVAKMFSMAPEDVEERVGLVTDYISGWKRKWEEYPRYRRNRKYYIKRRMM